MKFNRDGVVNTKNNGDDDHIAASYRS